MNYFATWMRRAGRARRFELEARRAGNAYFARCWRNRWKMICETLLDRAIARREEGERARQQSTAA